MTRGKINSRGIVVDYACGREEYPAGVIAPREVADYSDTVNLTLQPRSPFPNLLGGG